MSIIQLQLDWADLGTVQLGAGRLSFPDVQKVAAIYRFHFNVDGEMAEYIGEAVRLSERFGSYAAASGGLSTDTRMRNRMQRTLAAGGHVTVYRARPSLLIDSTGAELDLENKLQRVFVEHAAVTEALTAGRTVLNGRGYPPFQRGHILSGDPAATADGA